MQVRHSGVGAIQRAPLHLTLQEVHAEWAEPSTKQNHTPS